MENETTEKIISDLKKSGIEIRMGNCPELDVVNYWKRMMNKLNLRG